MAITHPLPGGRLTDRFGPRGTVAGLGDLGTHTGQDWASQEGTPIRAAHSGRVLRVWWDAFPNGAGAGGHMVSIIGDDGMETRYAHMMQPSHLPVGSRVIGNTTTVGYVGSTGAATGAHLHFEVLRAGSYVDPLPLITQGEDDMTPEQSAKLDAIYAGLYGPANVGAGEISWKSINGVQKAQFGNLEIDIYTQKLVAQLVGQVAGLTEAVKAIPGGKGVDMGALEAAAEKGARDALAGLVLKAG